VKKTKNKNQTKQKTINKTQKKHKKQK